VKETPLPGKRRHQGRTEKNQPDAPSGGRCFGGAGPGRVPTGERKRGPAPSSSFKARRRRTLDSKEKKSAALMGGPSRAGGGTGGASIRINNDLWSAGLLGEVGCLGETPLPLGGSS